ncbi:MAG: hypothetical protein Aurels2KO_12790 [Aureliella sp.]
MSRVHKIGCSEIWGGNRGDELFVETSGVKGCLYSRACDGGKGGDIYYFSVCGSDLLTRIAIADVVGHGDAVSTASGWLFDSLAARMNSADGNLVLEDLNRATTAKGLDAMSTATVAAFYRTENQLSFSYAGHHQLLLQSQGNGSWASLDAEESPQLSGLPLGVVDSCAYHQQNVTCNLGDRLFLYTDGLIEAMNSAGEQFGVERLVEVLSHFDAAEELTTIRQAVIDALNSFTGGNLDHDDVTFMILEFINAADDE